MVNRLLLLNQSDVADILNVSPRTVMRLRASGELKSIRVRGLVRFTTEDVVAFIKARREEGRP
jgi:excisionase family DNA binding protein